MLQDVSGAVSIVPHGLVDGVIDCGRRGALREADGGGDGGGERRARAMMLGRHRAAIGAIGDGDEEAQNN